MTVARFQVVPAARYVHLPAPRSVYLPAARFGLAPAPREADPEASVAMRRATGFAWRFMSANNRSLARSAQTCPDVESCLAAIRVLREDLPHAAGETIRNGNGQWVWRVRVAGEVVAITTRTYQRPVRARRMCDSFLELVAKTAASAPVQVIYR